jgi:predicted Abi (CAAX) family protease
MVANVFIFRKSQQVYFVPVSFGKMAFLFVTMLVAVGTIIYVQVNSLNWLYIIAAWVFVIIVIGLSRVDKDLRRNSFEVPENWGK